MLETGACGSECDGSLRLSSGNQFRSHERAIARRNELERHVHSVLKARCPYGQASIEQYHDCARQPHKRNAD